MIDEFRLIERIRKKIPRSLWPANGLSDDAGLLNHRGLKNACVSTDVIVEGVDFKIPQARPEEVGRKALAVNLSDMAAMGCKPLACTVALGLPARMKAAWVEKFYSGLTRLAKKYGVSVAGGDLSAATEFFAAVTIWGTPVGRRPVSRAGAKAGDWIAVTGHLGGSLAGHHLRFEPRVRESLFLAKKFRPHAMVDLSDGFLQDLGHLLKPAGLGARVNLEAVPVSQAAMRRARGSRKRALEAALADGEDFELLFCVAPGMKERLERGWKKRFPKIALHWVGRIQKKPSGLQCYRDGRRVRISFRAMKGYAHFRGPHAA